MTTPTSATTSTDLYEAGLPTYREILKVIEKIRDLLKEYLRIFLEIIANFKLDYGDYTRQLSDTDA